MITDATVRKEYSFLIPIRRDSVVSECAKGEEGQLHSTIEWDWLRDRLFSEFGGYHRSLTPVSGAWDDPDSDMPNAEISIRFWIAIPESGEIKLKTILAEAKDVFWQRVIYFRLPNGEALEI